MHRPPNTYQSSGNPGDVYRIDRVVVLEAIPAVVALRLERSVWAPAITVEPRGSGCSVFVAAVISPAGLGHRIEEEILASVLHSGHRSPTDYQSTHSDNLPTEGQTQ